MNIKKQTRLAFLSILALGSMASLASCGGKEYTVTFYDSGRDDKIVLSTVKVPEGKTVTKPADPKREGETFLKWYGTPSYSKEFDFTMPINADTSVFAKFQPAYVPDVRTWRVTGTVNAWKEKDVTYLMTKAADSNLFTVTMDFPADAEFKLTHNDSWDTPAASKALKTIEPAGAMVSKGGLGGDEPNISVTKSGKYELSYYSDLNELNAKRIGDVDKVELVYAPVLKGDVTNWAPVADLATSPWAFKKTAVKNVFELPVSLNKGDAFIIQEDNDKGIQLKYNKIDLASSDKGIFADNYGNINMLERAKYLIKLDLSDIEAKKVVITKTGAYEAVANEPVITWKLGATTLGSLSYKVGCKVEHLDAPTTEQTPVDSAFIGWYTEDSKLFAFDDMPIEKNVTVTAKFLGANEDDARAFHLYGSITGWAKDSKDYNFTKIVGSKHTYELVKSFKKDDQILVIEGPYSENQMNTSCVKSLDETLLVKGSGNIKFVKDAKVKITLDSYLRTLVITLVA